MQRGLNSRLTPYRYPCACRTTPSLILFHVSHLRKTTSINPHRSSLTSFFHPTIRVPSVNKEAPPPYKSITPSVTSLFLFYLNPLLPTYPFHFQLLLDSKLSLITMMMNQKPSIYIPTAYLDDIEYFYDSDDESSLDLTSTDEFRMYEFKIRRCGRARSHDWTECPFAHPGEKAKRRDPRKFHYSGTSCPDFRKGNCKRGDSCDMSHGVFECWLHPARYRTQPCKDGVACRRRVCFFAHTPEQLRVLPTSPKTVLEGYDGSPMRRAVTSPDSSPLLSPVIAGLRRLQLDKVKSMSMSTSCPSSSYLGMRFGDGFCSVPTTPTAGDYEENEGFVERVESGRALRMKLYERLCKENCTVEKKDSDADPVWFN